MAGNQHGLLIDKHRVGKPELPKRRAQLLNLPFGMGPGVAWIRSKFTDRPINDLQRACG